MSLLPLWIQAVYEAGTAVNPEWAMYCRLVLLDYCKGDEDFETIVMKLTDKQCSNLLAEVCYPRKGAA